MSFTSGPGYPQHPGPPPPPYGPPRRRGPGTALTVVLALVVAVGLLAAASVVIVALSDGSEVDTSDLTYTPVPEPSTYSAPPPADPSTSAEPSPDPEPVVTRASILKRNDLYCMRALCPAGCAAESQVPLDSVANLGSYYDSVLRCLNKTWSQLEPEGLEFRRARLVMHSGEQVSACGSATISFYCSSEDTIFMYAPEIIDPWFQFPGNAVAQNNIRLAAAHTIAHEYGHHVQNLARVFLVVGDIRGTTEENRLELQASCLGEAFLGSQADVYPITSDDFEMAQFWRYIPVPNHGTDANQALWGDRGLAAARPGDCNTWTAPRGEVA